MNWTGKVFKSSELSPTSRGIFEKPSITSSSISLDDVLAIARAALATVIPSPLHIFKILGNYCNVDSLNRISATFLGVEKSLMSSPFTKFIFSP